MDFSQFDQRGRAEAGTPHPILNPETLEPIVDSDSGEPCLVFVRSSLAPSVVAAMTARNRAAMLGADAPADKTLYEADDSARDYARPFIAGFRNVHKADGTEATEADAEWFLLLDLPMTLKPGGAKIQKTFAQQVIDAVNAEAAILGNAPAP